MAQTTPNWSKLVAQGRAKAPGIPWSNEELHAIHVLKIPVEDVRNGILTKEDLESQDEGPKPLKKMTKAELVAKAKELGIEFEEKVATKGDLILEIEKAEERKAKDAEAQGGDEEEQDDQPEK